MEKEIKIPTIQEALKDGWQSWKPETENKNLSYSDKLKNPLWQRKRLHILSLRNWQCELCKCDTKELHVHHKYYIEGREVWNYHSDAFQVLCSDCHKKQHHGRVD